MATSAASASPPSVKPDQVVSPPAPLAQREAGRRLFIRCVACHSVRSGGPRMTGPSLYGLIGRKAGSVAGFRYTTVLKDQSFVWTSERLEQWLRQPQKGMPGLCLPFTGFSSKADRAAMAAYLAHPQP